MYSDFFRLKEPPFSITPDPRYLYLSKRHQEALAHLLYGTGEEGGFVELTGEVGTGKTTLIRALLQSRLERVDVALILNPRLTVSEFVASICDELGVARPQRTFTLKPLIDALNQHLLKSHSRGRQTVLIVDEAQNLSLDVLEQVRLLTNLETSRHKLLRIILVGQPELKQVLDRHDMRQLAQRITARFHLEPLDRKETFSYIAHRLEVAGGQSDLISPSAVRRVHRYAGGIPRLINVICDRALLGAYANGQRIVDKRLVGRAAREALGTHLRSSKPLVLYRGLAAVLTLSVVGAGLYALIGDGEDIPGQELAAEFFGAEFSPAFDDDPGMETVAGETPEEPRTTPHQATAERVLASPVGGRSGQRTWHPQPEGAGEVTVPQDGQTLMAKVLIDAEPQSTTIPGDSAAGDVPPQGLDGLTSTPHTVTASVPDSGSVDVHVSLVRTLDQAAAVTLDNDSIGLAARLTALGDDPYVAYRQMFALWGEVFEPGGEAGICASLVSRVHRCFKGTTRWAELRGWNRPAVLRLYDDMGQTREVLLRALDRTHATLEIGNAGPARFPISDIDRLWAGHASVLWRLQTTVTLIGEGARGEPVLWLRKHLALIDDGASMIAANPAVYDSELAVQVKRFQTDRGLTADGIVGQRTMLYLNNLDPLPGTPVLHLSEELGAG